MTSKFSYHHQQQQNHIFCFPFQFFCFIFHACAFYYLNNHHLHHSQQQYPPAASFDSQTLPPYRIQPTTISPLLYFYHRYTFWGDPCQQNQHEDICYDFFAATNSQVKRRSKLELLFHFGGWWWATSKVSIDLHNLNVIKHFSSFYMYHYLKQKPTKIW